MLLQVKAAVAVISGVMLAMTGMNRGGEISVDVCQFKGEGGQSYVEVYFDLSRGLLTHKQTAEGWFGAVRLEVAVLSDTAVLAVDTWTIEDLAPDAATVARGQRIIDGRVYMMEPGEYRLNVTATDSLSGSSWSVGRRVKAIDFPDSMLAMSEVELGGYLLPPGEHPRFDRGDFTLIPNPRRLFGQVLPYFYYYFEVYPPESATGAADYEIRRYLVSGSGDTAKVLKPIAMTGGPGFFADIDSVGLGGVPSGTYNFTVEVIDAGGARAMQSAKMFVFAPEVPAGEALTTGGAGEYDSAAVERELQEIQFLLSKNETLVATKLSPAEKGRFLENFWRRYDDDPTTPEVPLRQLFRVRVDEADARWGNSRTAGHKSDRGRVYVLYGEPDERETHPLDIHAKPYEIWNYNNLEGGVTFVFVDRSGLGDFMLVHSTLRGEVVNTDWYREFVQRSGMDSRR